MASKKYVDYHDFVFKDGRFVGKFDEMYKLSTDTPWHQDTLSDRFSADLDLALLEKYCSDATSICDIGCGLGYFTSRIQKKFANKKTPPFIQGLDISETAARKASLLHEGIPFSRLDMLKATPPEHLHRYDVLCVRDILWYVCDNLDLFTKNILNMSKQGATLLVALSFPTDDTWVGKDIFSCPDDVVSHFAGYFDMTYTCVEQFAEFGFGNYLHLLGTIKKSE